MSYFMKPDSKQLPSWMRWLAQDADGAWWGYEHEPHLADIAWYENEVGLSIKLSEDTEIGDWKHSLQRI